MPEQRHTIVILTPAFPQNEAEDYWVPSQQSLVKAIAKNFPQWQVEVLSFSYPARASTYSWNNIPVTSFGGMKYQKGKRLLLWWKVWRQLKAIQRRKKIKALFSFWCKECALIGSWYGKLNSIPHYCWICGQDAKAGNRYVPFIRPAAKELVAISDAVAEEFSRNYRVRPAHIIPNAIDTTMFPQVNGQERAIDLLGVGALIPLKQFDLFIEIAAALKKCFPELRMVLCGEGEEKEKLVGLIKQFQLENNIILTGAIKRNKVINYMSRAKILLHPSAYEGFPTVCLEALYAGAQVISFVQPMKHPIENWHIVRNKEGMRLIAQALLANPGPGTSVLTYSMDAMAGKWMELVQGKEMVGVRSASSKHLA